MSRSRAIGSPTSCVKSRGAAAISVPLIWYIRTLRRRGSLGSSLRCATRARYWTTRTAFDRTGWILYRLCSSWLRWYVLVWGSLWRTKQCLTSAALQQSGRNVCVIFITQSASSIVGSHTESPAHIIHFPRYSADEVIKMLAPEVATQVRCSVLLGSHTRCGLTTCTEQGGFTLDVAHKFVHRVVQNFSAAVGTDVAELRYLASAIVPTFRKLCAKNGLSQARKCGSKHAYSHAGWCALRQAQVALGKLFSLRSSYCGTGCTTTTLSWLLHALWKLVGKQRALPAQRRTGLAGSVPLLRWLLRRA